MRFGSLQICCPTVRLNSGQVLLFGFAHRETDARPSGLAMRAGAKRGQTHAAGGARLSARQLAVLASNGLTGRAPGKDGLVMLCAAKPSANELNHTRIDRVAPFNSLYRFSSNRRIVSAFIGA